MIALDTLYFKKGTISKLGQEEFIGNINQMKSDWSETQENRRVCNCTCVKEKIKKTEEQGLIICENSYPSLPCSQSQGISPLSMFLALGFSKRTHHTEEVPFYF